MGLTFAKDSRATCLPLCTLQIGKGFLLQAERAPNKRSQAAQPFLVEVLWCPTVHLLMRGTLSPEPPQTWPLGQTAPPGESLGKITPADRPGRIIPPSDFLKPKKASGYLKKMWNLWLIFKRWEWLTVQKEVFSKKLQVDLCLGVLRFTKHCRHMILLDSGNNSVSPTLEIRKRRLKYYLLASACFWCLLFLHCCEKE